MAKYGNTVYLYKEAYWFPINPNKIKIMQLFFSCIIFIIFVNDYERYFKI